METINPYLEKWYQLPEIDIPKIFEYSQPSKNVVAYKLESQDLQELINPLNGSMPNQLRFTIGVNPSFDPSGPSSQPAFTLFTQSYFADSSSTVPPPDFLGAVHFMLTPTTITNPPVIEVIPQSQAASFVQNWLNLENNDSAIIDSFNTSGGRVKTYTFGTGDVDEIRGYLSNNTNAPLYAYLAWNVVLLPGSGESSVNSNFTLVLQVGEYDNGALNRYFEFSNPCPPSCQQLIN